MDEDHPLVSAVKDGNLEVVRKIINSDDAKGSLQGYDLLQVALQHNRTEIAKLLLLESDCSKVNDSEEFCATPLHYAAKYGDVEIVELLLDRNAEIDGRDGRGQTSLHRAIEENQIEVVKLLLSRRACVDATDTHGKTPLRYAVEKGSEQITKLLLKHNADVNFNACYVTPIEVAVVEGNQEIVSDLLNHGASVNTVCKSTGYTPLHLAAVHGRTEAARLLLMKGADVNAVGKYNLLPPLYIAAECGHRTTVKLLLEHGANVDAHDAYGETVLYCAVKWNRSDIVEEILKFGPDLNNESNRKCLYFALSYRPNYGYENPSWVVEDGKNKCRKIVANLHEYGFTINTKDINNRKLLHSAVKSGHLSIVEDFLRNGGDVNKKSVSKESHMLLHTAAMSMQAEVALCLINSGAYVNAMDESRLTPIFYAVQNGDLRITELLLANGASLSNGTDLLNSAVTKGFKEIVEILLQYSTDININVNRRDKCGRTALYCTVLSSEGAAVKGDIAKLLLSRGALINMCPTRDDKPILYAALQKGFVELAEVLLQYNVDVNSVCNLGITLLHVSAENGYESITRALLNKGAMVNAKRADGATALHLATCCGHENIVKILLERGATVNSKVHVNICGTTTPLHTAAQSGDVGIVKMLIKYGANVDALDESGSTALHMACFAKNKYVIRALLQNGSNINISNRDNLTALDSHLEGCRIVSNYSSIDKIFMRHIAKLKTNNLYVSEKILQTISTRSNLKHYYASCEREIEEMKNEKICNTNVSFYDILTKGVHQLAIYTRNESIVKALESREYVKMFPMYAEVLEDQFIEGQQRESLLESSIPSFNTLFGYELLHLITNKIFSYLSNLDLRNLISACDLDICDEN